MPVINAYATLEEADAYFENLLSAGDWKQHTADMRTRALATATAVIEQSVPVPFPRPEDNGVIPDKVLYALYAQALSMLSHNGAPDMVDREELQAQGVTSFSLDGLSETFGGARYNDGLCPEARRLLGGFIAKAARIITGASR